MAIEIQIGFQDASGPRQLVIDVTCLNVELYHLSVVVGDRRARGSGLRSGRGNDGRGDGGTSSDSGRGGRGGGSEGRAA